MHEEIDECVRSERGLPDPFAPLSWQPLRETGATKYMVFYFRTKRIQEIFNITFLKLSMYTIVSTSFLL